MITKEQQIAHVVKCQGKFSDMIKIICEGVEGALPNGTLIEKVNSEAKDYVQNGELGTIIGSLYVGHVAKDMGRDDIRRDSEFMYAIEWAGRPISKIEEITIIIDKKVKESGKRNRKCFVSFSSQEKENVG